MKKVLFVALMALLVQSASSGFAAIPSSGPGGENPQGLFATYFSTLVTNPCTGTNVLTGFNSTVGSDFLKATCTSFGNLLGAFFATFPAATEDEVLAGFNSTTGAPIYKVATSVWKNVVGGIAYSSGNVGIGTYDPQATLHVSGSLLARGLTDTTNSTWFPWTDNQNYIRGTTYLSGFLVDEQDINFHLNPADNSVLKNLAVSGSITGPAPTASNHLATKAYVDAAVSAGGGGGGMTIYQSDGVTKVGKFLSIAWTDPVNQTVCDALYYADNNNVLRVLGAENCAQPHSSFSGYFPNSTCDGSTVYYIPYQNVTGDVYKNSSGIAYGVTRTTPIIYAEGAHTMSYWDRATDSCKVATVNAAPTWYYANAAIGYGQTRVCGTGNCQFK